MTIKNPDGSIEEYTVKPNEACLMHAGGSHRFETISKEPCVFLAICAGVPQLNSWIDCKFTGEASDAAAGNK
jgi:mannose-6-phosphate isomerase-like protein (cupin superfamily)